MNIEEAASKMEKNQKDIDEIYRRNINPLIAKHENFKKISSELTDNENQLFKLFHNFLLDIIGENSITINTKSRDTIIIRDNEIKINNFSSVKVRLHILIKDKNRDKVREEILSSLEDEKDKKEFRKVFETVSDLWAAGKNTKSHILEVDNSIPKEYRNRSTKKEYDYYIIYKPKPSYYHNSYDYIEVTCFEAKNIEEANRLAKKENNRHKIKIRYNKPSDEHEQIRNVYHSKVVGKLLNTSYENLENLKKNQVEVIDFLNSKV